MSMLSRAKLPSLRAGSIEQQITAAENTLAKRGALTAGDFPSLVDLLDHRLAEMAGRKSAASWQSAATAETRVAAVQPKPALVAEKKSAAESDPYGAALMAAAAEPDPFRQALLFAEARLLQQRILDDQGKRRGF